MGWDISIISTFKEVFAEINSIKEPVGIIIFGADSDFKDQVCAKFEAHVRGLRINYSDSDSIQSAICQAPTGEYNLTVELSGEDSANHWKRHEVVKMLKSAGFKVVIGLYVKQEQIQPWSAALPEEIKKFNRQAAKLLGKPPTIYGLTNLIVVSES